MPYYRFKDEQGNEFGSFETFQGCRADGDPSDVKVGWYWWACFPGCLPDGEPCGPFQTEQDAINDAQENA